MTITRDARLNINVNVPLGDSIASINALMTGIKGVNDQLKQTKKGYDDLTNNIKPIGTSTPIGGSGSPNSAANLDPTVQQIDALHKAAGNATRTMSALVGWVDALATHAGRLSQSSVPVTAPSGGIMSKLGDMLGFANGGIVNMTNGGVVPSMAGVTPGSDWHPAFLTNDEHVINAKSAKKHRALLTAINADHYAVGGWVTDPLGGGMQGPQRPEYQIHGEKKSVQAVYVVNFNEMPHASGGGGGGSANTQSSSPGSSGPGFASRLKGAFGGAQRIAGAAGASNAAGIASAGGNLAGAVVAGGPAGIAVAGALVSIEAFKIGMDKTTAITEIGNNSRLSEYQKNRALQEELIPLASKFHALGDAVNGFHDKINRESDRHALAMAEIGARAQVRSEIGGREREVLSATSTAAGMRFGPGVVANRYFDINAPGGERAEREFSIRQQAQNALIHAQRASAGANAARAEQSDRTDRAHSARDEATRDRQGAEIRLQGWRERNARTGGGFFGSLTGSGDTRVQTTRAAHDVIETSREESGRNQQYGQEAEALQQRRVEAERQMLALAQARLGLIQAEAQIERERANRMTSREEGFGLMGRAGRRRAQRQFEVVQRRGIDNSSAETIHGAMSFDSEEIRRQARISGAEFARNTANIAGAGVQRDYAEGNTSEASRRRAAELEAIVQTGTDRAAIESAQRIGDIMANSLTRIGDIIQRRIAEVERDMLARFAERNQAT